MALSDPSGVLASPFTIINCQGDTADVAAIGNIIKQNQVARVIVGLPLSMDGSVGQQAEKVKAFTRKLCDNVEVPVEFRDERLTTVAAKQIIREAGGKKSRRKDSRDDAIAAALILQGYLDARREVSDEDGSL